MEEQNHGEAERLGMLLQHMGHVRLATMVLDDAKESMVIISAAGDAVGKALIQAVVETQPPAHRIQIVVSLETLAILILPIEVMQRVMSMVSPKLSAALRDKPLDGHLWLGVVAVGGTTLVHIQMPPPLPAVGEA